MITHLKLNKQTVLDILNKKETPQKLVGTCSNDGSYYAVFIAATREDTSILYLTDDGKFELAFRKV